MSHKALFFQSLKPKILKRLQSCDIRNATRASTSVREIDRIRNIGILAHVDGGKTTLTERILFAAGVTNRMGDVDKGNTVTDFLEMERERGITVNSAAVSFPWTPERGLLRGKRHVINLIDTPGHVDFTVEVERALRVLDGVVVLLDASAGVQPQTAAVWRLADKYNLPRIVLVNKLDKPNANFYNCVKSLNEKLSGTPLVCHTPMGQSNNKKTFTGFVDIVNLTKHEIGSLSDDFEVSEAPLNNQELKCENLLEARDNLLNVLAEFDDSLSDLLLSDDFDSLNIETEVIEQLIQKVCQDRGNISCYPVFCLSALRSLGVRYCIDAVCNFLPPPNRSSNESVSGSNYLQAFVFKIFSNPQFQKTLTYIRVYRGCLKSTDVLQIVGRGRDGMEQVANRLYELDGESVKKVHEIGIGRLGVVMGLRHAKNGDTLCRKGEQTSALPGFAVPKPVVFCRVEVESAKQIPKLTAALTSLCREDPSLAILDVKGVQKLDTLKPEDDFVIGATGQLHLEFIKHRLSTEFRLNVRLGPLNVQLKETVAKSASFEESKTVRLRGIDNSISVKLSVQPLWNNSMSQGSLPLENLVMFEPDHLSAEGSEDRNLQAVKAGIYDGLQRGHLGYKAHHLSLVLHHFSTSDNCSPAVVQSTVASAVRSAMKKATSLLLEPYMEIEIAASNDVISDVIDDITNRRADVKNVLSPEASDDLVNVAFVAPLSKILDYSKEVRIKYSGKVSINSMTMASYSLKTEQQ